MKVKNIFKNVLTEMTQAELDSNKKRLEQEFITARDEVRRANDSEKARAIQKMNAIRTKLNSLKMMRPVDKIRTSDSEEEKKEILARRKIQVHRDGEKDRRSA
jgi:uncharacterized membrane protein